MHFGLTDTEETQMTANLAQKLESLDTGTDYTDLSLAVAGVIGAMVAGFFHYMKVGPVEDKAEKEEA